MLLNIFFLQPSEYHNVNQKFVLVGQLIQGIHIYRSCAINSRSQIEAAKIGVEIIFFD